MTIELTVIVKDSERNLRQKFLCYEEPVMSIDDKYIRNCVEKTVTAFGDQPEEVTVKTTMHVTSLKKSDENNLDK